MREVLDLLRQMEVGGEPLLSAIRGIQADAHPAFTLSRSATASLEKDYRQRGLVRSVPNRMTTARRYAQHRGRISTTELGATAGALASNVDRS